MSDNDGDNVWEFTTLLLLVIMISNFPLTIEHTESLDTNLSCVNWVLDSNLSSGIAVNRSVEVINSDIVLDVVRHGVDVLHQYSGYTDITK